MDWPTRQDHINRVAYLVEHGWGDPLSINVGVPDLGCHVSWIIEDGNHRLAAALYRKDETIQVSPSGDLDHFAEIFSLVPDPLE